ncbi:uncharacterized mitochondrial protein AtMg00810-like [Rutidosis leptorrhynchoides]|uniref:uncharacterized mitochondrial protein AtMg00810-like n=1 Tax=Rutidosis leptorrhynchoides TaxID=125765 RepID=UPI003A994091
MVREIYFSHEKLWLKKRMIDYKLAETPVIPNQKLFIENGAQLANQEEYQKIVGKLIYLSHTRPDLAYSGEVVSQFLHEPQVHHMEAVWKIIRYLKGTAGHGVLFKNNGHLKTQIYTDAAWGGEKGGRKST